MATDRTLTAEEFLADPAGSPLLNPPSDRSSQSLPAEHRLPPVLKDTPAERVNSVFVDPTEADVIKLGVTDADRAKWQGQTKIGFFENAGRHLSSVIPLTGVVGAGLLFGSVKRLQHDRLIEKILVGSGEFPEVRKAQPFAVGAGAGFGRDLATEAFDAPPPKRRSPAERNADIQRVNQYLRQIEEEATRGVSIPGHIGRGLLEMPEFMLTFLATGGLAAAGKESFEIVAKKVLGKAISKSLGGRAVIAVGRTAAGAVPRTFAAQNVVGEQFFQRQVNSSFQLTEKGFELLDAAQERPFTSYMHALEDTFIEMFSEETGAFLAGVGGRLRQGLSVTIDKTVFKVPGIKSKLAAFGKNLELFHAGSKTARTGRALWTKAGIHGMFEEMGEEQIGDLLRATFGLETFGAENPEQILDRIAASIHGADELLINAGIFGSLSGARTAQGAMHFALATKLKNAFVEPEDARLMTREQVAAIKGEGQETEFIRPTQEQVDRGLQEAAEASADLEKQKRKESKVEQDDADRQELQAQVAATPTPNKDIDDRLQEVIRRVDALPDEAQRPAETKTLEAIFKDTEQVFEEIEKRRRLLGESSIPAEALLKFRKARDRLQKSRQGLLQAQGRLSKQLAETETQFRKATKQSDFRKLRIRQAAIRAKLGRIDLKFAKRAVAADLQRAKSALVKKIDRDAQDRLKQRIKDIDPTKLPSPQREQVEDILGAIQSSKPQEATLARLQGTLDFLRSEKDSTDRRASVLPLVHIEELERLIKEPVSNLRANDARAISSALDHFEKLALLKLNLKKIQDKRDSSDDALAVASDLASPDSVLTAKRRLASGEIDIQVSPGFIRMAFDKVTKATLDVLGVLVGGVEDSAAHRILAADIVEASADSRTPYYEGIDARDAGFDKAKLDPAGDEVASWSAVLADVKHKFLAPLTFGALPFLTKARVELWTDSSARTIALTDANKMHIISMMRDAETHDAVLFQKNPDKSVGIPLQIKKVVASQTVEPSATGAKVADSEIIQLTPQLLADITASMTTEQMIVIDSMVDHLNGPFKKMMQAWSLRRHKVQIMKPGTWMARHRIRTGTEIEEALSSANFEQKGVEQAGLVLERTGGVDPIEIRDMFVEYENILHIGSSLVHVGPAITRALNTLNSAPVKAILHKHKNGQEILTAFRRRYDGIAARIVPLASTEDMFGLGIRNVVRRVTTGMLKFSIKIAAYQTVSSEFFKQEIPAKYIRQARRQRAAFTSAVDGRMRKEGWVRARQEGTGMSIINESVSSGAKLGGRLRANNLTDERGFHMLRWGDNNAIRVGWVGSELWAADQIRAENKKLGTKREVDPLDLDVQELAGRIARKAIRRTQPTFDAATVSGLAVSSGKQPVRLALLMFRAQKSKIEDMSILTMHNLRVGMNKAKPGEKRKVFLQGLGQLHRIWVLGAAKITAIQQLWDFAIRASPLLIGLSMLPEDEEEHPLINELRRFGANILSPLLPGGFVAAAVDTLVARPLFKLFTDDDLDQDVLFDPTVSPAFAALDNVFTVRTPAVVQSEDMTELLIMGERLLEAMLPFVGGPLPLVRDARKVLEAMWEAAEADRNQVPSASD